MKQKIDNYFLGITDVDILEHDKLVKRIRRNNKSRVSIITKKIIKGL